MGLSGGVRSAPAKEDLRRFIDTAGSLNGSEIAVKLHEKLEGNNWQECYRALCAIEAVILQGSSVSCGEIGVHFQVRSRLLLCLNVWHRVTWISFVDAQSLCRRASVTERNAFWTFLWKWTMKKLPLSRNPLKMPRRSSTASSKIRNPTHHPSSTS